MHKYASASNESRELVSELEFVWDQVKSNVPSSNSSSPLRTSAIPHEIPRPAEVPRFESFEEGGRARARIQEEGRESMQVMSPVSKDRLDLEAAGDVEDEEEFVDAPDSQVDQPPRLRNVHTILSSPSRGGPPDPDGPMGEERRRKRRSYPPPAAPPSSDEAWKKNMSAGIIKLTAELAAVREQLEARRLFTHTLQFRIFRFVTATAWAFVKHVAVDALLLALVLLWFRRKRDQRLEDAVRVLLGDAVVQAQRLGDKQLSKLHLPLLGSGARKK